MPSDPVRQPSAAPSSVWVKICGVRDLATLRQVIAAGAQAVGLNFYAASPRSVTVDVAHALSR
ncbi:MAG: phosphoribosylanthranilate isomerase, partial [Planctomycetaceae bacterium]